MKKQLIVIFSLVLIVSCGSSTTSSNDNDNDNDTADSIVTMSAQMSDGTGANLIKGAVYDDDDSDDSNLGDPKILDGFITPSNYSIALIKVEVGTVPDTDVEDQDLAENFTAGFTVYEQDSVDEAELFDITTSADIGNTTNCVEGTYNALRTQILFLQMTMDANIDGTGLSEYIFRNFTTEYNGGGDYGSAKIGDGDILAYVDDAYHWIDSDSGDLVTTRPANPVYDPYFSGENDPHSEDAQYTSVSGVYVFQPVTVIDPELEITDCDSETYTFTTTFDVSDTFFFDDCDENGDFEPGGNDMIDGAYCNDADASWYPGPPAISSSFSGS